MSTTNEIFYSQVNKSLQDELNARGRSGFNRSTTDLNYMLTKVGNAQITAYSDQDYKTAIYTLGGKEVLTDPYIAGKKTGFLATSTWETIDTAGKSKTSINNSFRVPPFLTSAEIQLHDHSFGLLNSATVLIMIPNPDRDLAFTESVFARPGRAIRMQIAHPDTALANKNKVLDTDPLPDGFPYETSVKDAVEQSTKSKINEVTFDGLIISFDYIYQTDGTVLLTVYLRGVSDVYTDTSLYTSRKGPENAVPISNTSFYDELAKEVKSIINNSINPNIKITPAFAESGLYPAASTSTVKDRSWVNHIDWNGNNRIYITLSSLVDAINRMLIVKQTSIATNAQVICNETLCFSNYFEDLVSSEPDMIWLLSPIGSAKGSDVYGGTNSSRPAQWAKNIKQGVGSLGSFFDKHPIPKENTSVGYPSRILINLELVNDIYKSLKTGTDDFNVSKFFDRLSRRIFNATGGAVNMKLITVPTDGLEKLLFFYDANYLGDMHKIKPYSVPMFANHPNGTIVRELKIQSKLPQNMQSLMYTINRSDTISEDMIAPFMSYMYNNSTITRKYTADGIQDTSTSLIPNDTVQKYEQQYVEFYKKYREELNTAKQNFNLTNQESRIALETALKKYVQYPDASLAKAAQIISPVYPVEVDFTIDGINGFKYGDALEFNALPERYKINTTFSIISIIHTINSSGDWTTKIICIMRPRFDK